MHTLKKIAYSLSTFILASSSFAAGWTSAPVVVENNLRPIVTLSAGGMWVSKGEHQSFRFDSSTYNFESNNTKTAGLLGIFGGAEFTINPLWALQLGLGYYQSSSFTTSGTLSQGSEIPFSKFDYDYTISSRQLLVESKFLTTYRERFHPYLSLGLGQSFNKASDYTVNNSRAPFSPRFGDSTTNTFSYTAGLGVDYDITSNIRLGLGYRFADLGKVGLGNGKIDNLPISHTLKQSNLYTNQLLAQLSWIF